jgi:hypothetical protein
VLKGRGGNGAPGQGEEGFLIGADATKIKYLPKGDYEYYFVQLEQ